MLRLAAFGAPLALAAALAAPAVHAQAVDCANIPGDIATAEPPEYAQCHPPLVVVQPGESSGALPAWGINLRAGGGPGRGFISFDYSSGTTATLVTANAGAWYAGDFAGNNFAEVYAVETPTAGVPNLSKINTTTGAVTLVGPTGLAALANVAGMAWDYTTSTMYAVSAANLYTVNLTTGLFTLVGATGLTTPIDLLAHPTTGQLYTVDIGPDNFYSINKASGASTLIGSLNYPISFAQGMDFDNASSVAYMCAYVSGGVNTIRTVDLATGNTTQVSGFTNSEVDICASMNPRVSVASEVGPGGAMASLTAEPNPFTSRTQLLVRVAEAQQVRVDVYDVTGRLLTTLFDGEVNTLSPSVVVLEGSGLRPGVYIVRATGETFVETQQVTLTR
jgi:hypothetical protein